jgi:hypothetical protein
LHLNFEILANSFHRHHSMKKYVLSVLIFLLFHSINISSQIIRSKLDFIGGIGYPEFIHGGLRYQYTGITQVGFYYGGDMGIKPEIIRTWTGDNLIHFGKHSYAPNRPFWYARQGFTYAVQTTTDRIYRYSYIDASIGREFGINDWIGINADMGFIGQVREKIESRNSGDQPLYRTDLIWKPLIRFQVFISI